MSAGNRIAIIAVGLVAAILAFVALRPADDEESASTTTATTQATTTATNPGTSAVDVETAATTAAPKPTGPKTTTVRVRGGQPVGGVRDISAKKGDEVRIRVTADAPEEVHLHGYDIEKPVGPGTPAVFAIDADLEGIFEIELHGSGVQIANLRVNPR